MSSSTAEPDLRASHTSAHTLAIAVALPYDMVNAAAAEEEGDEGERPEAAPAADILGALRGGALALARSAAFLARCVAKVCSFTALSAGPVSQPGSLDIVGGEDGAGMGVAVVAAVVAAVSMVGLEATLGMDLGMVMNGTCTWSGWDDVVQSSE